MILFDGYVVQEFINVMVRRHGPSLPNLAYCMFMHYLMGGAWTPFHMFCRRSWISPLHNRKGVLVICFLNLFCDLFKTKNALSQPTRDYYYITKLALITSSLLHNRQFEIKTVLNIPIPTNYGTGKRRIWNS
ncbi:hypothetical protein ACJX0J_016472 [Zea mays]